VRGEAQPAASSEAQPLPVNRGMPDPVLGFLPLLVRDLPAIQTDQGEVGLPEVVADA
jgi:hypothetical protein